MTQPVVLDLFSGGGGAGMGYARCGFKVIGIDNIDHKKSYSHVGNFYQMDWSEGLDKFGKEANFIHASPPCQLYSLSTQQWRAKGYKYPDLIPDVREALTQTGLPYVLENVPQASLRRDAVLCGSMFGLSIQHRGYTFGLRRHRVFEANFSLPPAPSCDHSLPSCPVFGHSPSGSFYKKYGGGVPVHKCRELMGISWMTGAELSESIPPVYTEWIAEHHSASQIS